MALRRATAGMLRNAFIFRVDPLHLERLGSVSVLGDHERNFAWGGSTAIRREIFERMGILNAWQGPSATITP